MCVETKEIIWAPFFCINFLPILSMWMFWCGWYCTRGDKSINKRYTKDSMSIEVFIPSIFLFVLLLLNVWTMKRKKSKGINIASFWIFFLFLFKSTSHMQNLSTFCDEKIISWWSDFFFLLPLSEHFFFLLCPVHMHKAMVKTGFV